MMIWARPSTWRTPSMSMPVLNPKPKSYRCGANKTSAGAAPNATWFSSYHSIADHGQFLKDLAAAYPNNAEIFSAGKSVEGRDLTGIHIWGSGGKGSQK